jgi:aldose 1-epimerase
LIARDIGKGDSAELDFKANKMMVRDQDYVLTGEYLPQSPGPWDDTFVEIIGTPEIIWPGAARLTVESDAPFWNVYTESEDGICLAPQTAPPNAQLLGISGESYIEGLFTFSEYL